MSSSASRNIDIDLVRRAIGRAGRESRPDADDRLAAVSAVLRDAGRDVGPEVLLIRRAAHDADPWSGHMAFPGGRHDPSDPDLLHTALRETLEEVGLDLARDAELIGRLPLLPAIARGRRVGLTIAPYVFALSRDLPLEPNREVAEIVWAPLRPMARGEISTTIPWELAGERLEMPAYDVHGRIVWGLTYRMLESLFEEIARHG